MCQIELESVNRILQKPPLNNQRIQFATSKLMRRFFAKKEKKYIFWADYLNNKFKKTALDKSKSFDLSPAIFRNGN